MSAVESSSPPEVLWRPDPARVESSQLSAFRRWLAQRGLVDARDYDDLWRWSVTEVGPFWSAVAEFLDVRFHDAPTTGSTALADGSMPGATWFPGTTVNYAEHALRHGPGKADDDVAIIAHAEGADRREVTFGQLRHDVAAFRAALTSLGVSRGDRVVGLVANTAETIVAFLAVASLGAIWSPASPDFGIRAVRDRFAQLDPTVLIAVDGYRYGGKPFSTSATVAELRGALPTLAATVLIPGPDSAPSDEHDDSVLPWSDLLDRHAGAGLEFAAVPFDHPLWVLYSSGTTGLPKGIVHGHGGITLEHLKALALHFDAGPEDRFLWFTTTGWMMWNFLVSGLLVGSAVVLYDGSPGHPSLRALWELAASERLTIFGTSAPYVQACLKDGLTLDDLDLSALRIVGSTGAPLSADGFRWLGTNLGPDVQIASFSGGTDLCTGFVGPAPDVPVWSGELSRPSLGAAVAAFSPMGEPRIEEVGELVITAPMPSMPVSFWNDPDGSRLREAYFADFPGVWRHGDWITITARGSAIIHGRSDSTLNRGGVRMGTAEFYRVVESHPSVVDSLVVDTSGPGENEGQLVCFVVLAPDVELDDVIPDLRRSLRSGLSPRHVPDEFVAVAQIPRTLNGKKCEVPVKRILGGAEPATAVSREALRNPDSLEPFVTRAQATQDL